MSDDALTLHLSPGVEGVLWGLTPHQIKRRYRLLKHAENMRARNRRNVELRELALAWPRTADGRWLAPRT